MHRVQEYEVGGRTVRSGGLFQTGEGGNIIDLDTLTGVDVFPKVAGLNYYGQIGDFVNAYLRALESSSRFEVISRPSIYLSNNRVGTIASGQTIQVPSATNTGGLSNGVNTSFRDLEVLLRLQVVPLINSADEVTLQIFQTNNTLGQFRVVGGLEVPDVNRQELQTEITVPNKSTIVLGGLITERRNDTKIGLPVLVHVPLLKHLFGNNSKEKNRQELLIFIQPHIVNDATDLANANLEQTENNRVTQSALESSRRPASNGSNLQEPDREDSGGRRRSSWWDRFRSRR